MRTLSIFDRIVLSVYTVGLIVVALFLLALAGGWVSPLTWFTAASHSQSGRATLALVGLVLLLTSVRLLAVAFSGGRRGSAVVHDLPLGKVRVSLGAIEGLVVRLVRQVPGVRDAKALVRVEDEALQVKIRAVVGPEIPIGELAEELQQNVRNQVRQVVGVQVENVVVEITNITPKTQGAGRLR